MHVYLPCRITHRVRKLLMLIPTDPQISETLECIANKVRLNRPTDYSMYFSQLFSAFNFM